MSRIEGAAEQSVARGVGFGLLAIAMMVAGLIAYPVMALKTGAALALLMWAVLRLKALRAPTRPYKRTEAWLLLDPRPTLPAEVAQRLIGEALRRALERYARYALAGAALFWAASLVAAALGLG